MILGLPASLAVLSCAAAVVVTKKGPYFEWLGCDCLYFFLSGSPTSLHLPLRNGGTELLMEPFSPPPILGTQVGCLKFLQPKENPRGVKCLHCPNVWWDRSLGSSSKHPLVSSPKQQGLKVLGQSILELRAPFLLGYVGNLFMD